MDELLEPNVSLDEVWDLEGDDPRRSKSGMPKRSLLIAITVGVIVLVVAGSFLIVRNVARLRVGLRPEALEASVNASTLLEDVEPPEVGVPALPSASVEETEPIVMRDPNLVRVRGPAAYAGTLPYLARYEITVVRSSGSLEMAVVCEACLWDKQPEALRVDHGGVLGFEGLVVPPDPAVFELMVNGRQCLTWTLSADAAGEAYDATCAPPD